MNVFKLTWKLNECSHGEYASAILVAEDDDSAVDLLLSQDFFNWSPNDLHPEDERALREEAPLSVAHNFALADNEWFDQGRKLESTITVEEVDLSKPQFYSLSQLPERVKN